MIFAVILLGFLQIVTLLGLAFLSRWYLERRAAELEARAVAALHEWVDQPAPDQPSKLALLVDAAGSVVGRAAAQSIMASLSASDSQVARVANGAADEMQGAANPLLGLLSGGKRGKGAAVRRLAEMLGPMLIGSHAASGNGQSVRGRLQKGG